MKVEGRAETTTTTEKQLQTWIFRTLLISSIGVIVGGIVWAEYLFSNRIVAILIPSPVEDQVASFFILYRWILIGGGLLVASFIVNAILKAVLANKDAIMGKIKRARTQRSSISGSTENPEALIANINRLHATSMQAIEKKDFGSAEKTLLTESKQYERVHASFVKMNLTTPADRASRKKKEIEDLIYVVKDARFATEYILLQNKFEVAKKDNNFQKMGDVLNEMSALLGARVQLARENGRTEDLEKYTRLLSDVKAQSEYARLYLAFLRVERYYNDIVPMIPDGKYKESMVALQDIESGTLKDLDTDTAKLKGNNPEIEKLAAQVHRLQGEIKALIAKIQGAYEQLLDSSTPVKIGAEIFQSGLTAPTVANVEASKDLTQALAEMERHFKDWDDNARSKNGKV